MNAYLKDMKNERLGMKLFPAGQPLADAQAVLTGQIDRKYIVPFLLLNPISGEWRDYQWHWFLIAGYRWEEGRLFVKTITYGNSTWLPFDGLWDTVHDDNGGMILYYFREDCKSI